MLRKLLKYDFRAVFRFWWIVALISVGMAVLGGYAQIIINSTNEIPYIIVMAANLVTFLSYFCMVGLALLTQVLLFIRFYRNFFTDEGYLTFTLPVKRETLLNSKVLAGFTAMAASVSVCALNVFIMFLISERQRIQSGELSKAIYELFSEVPSELMGYLVVYGVEILIIIVLLLLLSVLFLYCCITFGSMIVKKGKLFASIGIYYGANSISTAVIQLMLIFGIFGMFFGNVPNPEQNMPVIVVLILLLIILFFATLCALFYAFTHWMLDRKLNLS